MRSSLPSPHRGSAAGAVIVGTSLFLGGCGVAAQDPGDPGAAANSTLEASPQVTEAAPADSGLPHDALPEIPGGRESWEDCPYLDTAWVEETNGQRVLGVGTDPRFDTPACVYWSYPDAPQLTVIVRDMPDEAAAIAVVDWAAPIDSTEPAEEPEGWSGGRAGAGMVPGGLPTGHDGALYAVQKDNRAVVVFTNQDQSLKAELVAKEVIDTLGG